MGFLDKMKDFMSVPEEDYSEESFGGAATKRKIEDEYTSPRKPVAESAPTEKKNKFVNIHATTQLQVVLVKPERFDDAPGIADHLNNKRTVVLNLESANKETSRRLIDFLSGVAYANNGQIKRVANSTFIITPFDVDIMGDLILDELESSSMYI